MKSFAALVCALALNQCSYCDKDEEEDYIPTTVPMVSYGSRSNEVMAKEGEYSIAVIGDSITEHWENYPECEPDNYVNLGVGGENIQGTLWRVRNGQFDNIKADKIVVNIGANNMLYNTLPDIENGISTVVREIEERTEAEVEFMHPFPSPVFAHLPYALSGQFDGGIDIMDEVSGTHAADQLHYTKETYCIWRDAID